MLQIDCFLLSSIPDYNVCLEYDSKGNLYFNDFYWWKYHALHRLIRTDKCQMKMSVSSRTENNTKPFNGYLEGFAITAAFNWTQSGKEYLYMFAGRLLCRQQISFDWVPMCDIEDISNLVIGCSHRTGVVWRCNDETDNINIYVIISVIVVSLLLFAILVVIGVYYAFIRSKNNSKEKSNKGL